MKHKPQDADSGKIKGGIKPPFLLVGVSLAVPVSAFVIASVMRVIGSFGLDFGFFPLGSFINFAAQF